MRRERREQTPHPGPKSEIVLPTPVRQLETPESSIRIKSHLVRYVEGIPVRYILGHHLHETTGEIGRQLGRRTLIDHHIVDQRRRKHIERECPAVRLARRSGRLVQPYIIISLRQPPDHHKTVIHDRKPRNTAQHLGGITVLCLADLLG